MADLNISRQHINEPQDQLQEADDEGRTAKVNFH